MRQGNVFDFNIHPPDFSELIFAGCIERLSPLKIFLQKGKRAHAPCLEIFFLIFCPAMGCMESKNLHFISPEIFTQKISLS
jgi:hypothetical protein